MKANETDFVFFDSILAVADRQVQSHDRPGPVLREVIRQTPQGTPLRTASNVARQCTRCSASACWLPLAVT